MIGLPSQRKGWIAAAVLSLSLHGATAAALLYRPDWGRITAPPPVTQIEISTVQTTTLAAPDSGNAVLTSSVLPNAPLSSVTEESPNATPPDEVPEQFAPDPVLPEAEILSPDLSPVPSGQLSPAAPEPPSSASGPEGGGNAAGPAPDLRLADLLARIRERLTDPCLLAQPVLRGDDDIQLNILTSDDRQVTELVGALTRDLDIVTAQETVLLDPRQCPAVTFLRNDPQYPAFALGLTLESQSISSGMSLRGQILNGTGYYTTLLLVDDNGVVHDLRRFLVVSASGVSFDVPLARAGLTRDTHQLLIAIATQSRPRSITEHAGELAEEVFMPLAQELAPTTLIGASSVYVR